MFNFIAAFNKYKCIKNNTELFSLLFISYIVIDLHAPNFLWRKNKLWYAYPSPPSLHKAFVWKVPCNLVLLRAIKVLLLQCGTQRQKWKEESRPFIEESFCSLISNKYCNLLLTILFTIWCLFASELFIELPVSLQNRRWI